MTRAEAEPNTGRRKRTQRTARACLTIAVASLALASPAAATWPGGNGRIYLQQGGAYGQYSASSLAPDGTDLRSEAAIPGFSLNLGPDGATSAFFNGQGPVLAKLDGSSSTSIGGWFDGGAGALGIAPDGGHVDGLYSKSTGQYAVRQTDLSGNTVHDFGFGTHQTTTCAYGNPDTFWDRTVTTFGFGGISIGPDGRILAYDSHITGF